MHERFLNVLLGSCNFPHLVVALLLGGFSKGAKLTLENAESWRERFPVPISMTDLRWKGDAAFLNSLLLITSGESPLSQMCVA